jgi:hypothetical protein
MLLLLHLCPLKWSSIIYPNGGSCLATVQEGLSRKERLALKVAEAAQQKAIEKLSLQRAKAEAAALEGASWGMMEDAEEDEEEEVYPDNSLIAYLQICTCPLMETKIVPFVRV